MVAGLELGSTCLECPTLYVIWGMNGALATLVSSAYGAGELQLCGQYLNRARLISTVVFVILSIVVIFMEPILGALGQDEKVIENALTYIYYNLPGAYFAGMFDL